MSELKVLLWQQGKSEGFDSCDRPSNLKLDSNLQFFHQGDHEIWWITLKNNRVLLLYYVKLCASFQIHWWIQTGFTVQKCSIRVEIGDILSRVTFLEIWWMTLNNNRTSLLYYIKLCASFQSHGWIQTGVTVWKLLIWVKISNLFSRVTLNVDGCPLKTLGHLSFASSSSVHHSVPNGEFKLELHAGNAQFGSKSMVFF